MSTIVNIPIEPLEERYSKNWHNWFSSEFENLKIKNKWILPEKRFSDKIENGEFLDVYDTNYYKSQQLQLTIEMIRNSSPEELESVIFFFHDLWFPGIEMLQYIKQGCGLNFKIAGYLHAGTWDSNDFLSKKGMSFWGRNFEESFLKIADLIFVATDFHKNLITNYFKQVDFSTKIKVVGMPIYCENNNNSLEDKSIFCSFPHRLASEKQPELFDRCKNHYNDICKNEKNSWIKTVTKTNDKNEYYNILTKSKYSVSFALQETCGISMMESVLSGCIPIVPDRLSYSELYFDIFKYDGSDNNYDDILAAKLILDLEENKSKDKIKKALDVLKLKFKIQGYQSIPIMISEMFLLVFDKK